MADSGASAFIFLMTALIVSASVSAILIDSWKGIADTYADGRDKAALDAKTEISFAGNPMMVSYDPGTTTMVFYLQNTGESLLESNVGGVFVDGDRPCDSVSSALLGGGTVWAPGGILRVTSVCNTWTYSVSPASEVNLLLIATSEVSMGVRGTDSLYLDARLN